MFVLSVERLTLITFMVQLLQAQNLTRIPTIIKISVETYGDEQILKSPTDFHYQVFHNNDHSGTKNLLRCYANNADNLRWEFRKDADQPFNADLPNLWKVRNIAAGLENRNVIYLDRSAYEVLLNYTLSESVLGGYYRCVAATDGETRLAVSPTVRMSSVGLANGKASQGGTALFNALQPTNLTCDYDDMIRPIRQHNSVFAASPGVPLISYSWKAFPSSVKFNKTNRMRTSLITGNLYFLSTKSEDVSNINEGLECNIRIGQQLHTLGRYNLVRENEDVVDLSDEFYHEPTEDEINFERESDKNVKKEIKCLEGLPCQIVCIFGGRKGELGKVRGKRVGSSDKPIENNSSTGFVFTPTETTGIQTWACELYDETTFVVYITLLVKVRVLNMPRIIDADTNFPVSKLVPPGSTVEFECKSRHASATGTTLYFNGRQVTRDYPEFGEFDSSIPKLTIAKVDLTHSASVSCEVRNLYGTVQRTSNLYVTGDEVKVKYEGKSEWIIILATVISITFLITLVSIAYWKRLFCFARCKKRILKTEQVVQQVDDVAMIYNLEDNVSNATTQNQETAQAVGGVVMGVGEDDEEKQRVK